MPKKLKENLAQAQSGIKSMLIKRGLKEPFK
jgi:hypothetical protein